MPTLLELDTAFSAFSQQTLDTLVTHSVRIDAAQSDADAAQVSANTALTKILQTGLDATVYTDEEIERIRLALVSQISTVTGSMNQTIADEVQAQIALFDPTLRQQLGAAISDVNTIAAALSGDYTNFNTVSNQLLNSDLPNILGIISGVEAAQIATANEVAVKLADLGFASVAGGIDAAIQTAVELVQPLGHTVLAGPAALWTTTSTGLLSVKVPPLLTDFATDDPSFGSVYQFPVGNQTIGPAVSLPYDNTRVYRMMIRFRVVSDGTSGGVDLAVGTQAWAPGTNHESPTIRYTVADGDRQLYVYATGSPDMLPRLSDKVAIDMTDSLSATQIFPYVRQNVGGFTDGILRLHMLEILDVTDAFEARAATLDQIDADPPLVPAGLVVTSVDLDGVRHRMTATWDLATEDGVVGYDVAVAQGAGNEVVFPVASNQWEADVAPGATYTVRVRSRDRFVNDSAYSAVVSHTVAGDAIISEDNLGDISASKIVVAGATRLSDWRTGGDETKINGGAISANTISANKLTIGSRNLTITGLTFDYNFPADDQVTWTAGTISYENDAGVAVSQAITSGAATWTVGTLYLCWDQGSSTIIATDVIATAYATNRIILATYKGSNLLQANYGRTIIDGASIKTGSIGADQISVTNLSALAASLGDIEVGSANIVDGAIINAKIGAAAIGTANIQNGAVTNRFAAFTAGSLAITTSYQLAQSLTIDADGNPVSISFTTEINGGTSIEIDIRVDNVSQRTFFLSSGVYADFSGFSGTGFGSSGVNVNGSGFISSAPSSFTVNSSGTVFIQTSVVIDSGSYIFYRQSGAVNMIVTPAAGSRSIEVYARRNGGLASNPVLLNRFLETTELKR